MTALLAAAATSILLVEPAPLEMPRANAYLVRSDGALRLEDRYATGDLWLNRAVTGRWIDEDLRVFTAARLENLPPAVAAEATRAEYVAGETAAKRKDDGHVLRMVASLAPVPPVPEYTLPRQLPRGLREVRYYQGTNAGAIVCAYLPERAAAWRYAAWELADGDDFAERLEAFEDELLWQDGWRRLESPDAESAQPEAAKPGTRRGRPAPGERELLRADAAHSVAAYPEWHFTSSEEFAILDNLRNGRDFVAALTNELPALRRRYAEILPTPLDGSNVLAVARIYRNREDYEFAAGVDLRWSAAYWNPARRELVACLPPDGDLAALRRTFRHEAFHQYLSYATSMIAVSPWLNEGYAQYFEDETDEELGLEVPTDGWDELELQLPALMMLDYRAFYAGTDDERRTKYKLARSLAVFLEHGAPEVRFEPFKDVKRNYVSELLRSHDMRSATLAAFGSEEKLKFFANEWKKYWKSR